MKEQIEEMADDLLDCHIEFTTGVGEIYTDYTETARKMYVKGYRKQSEGEWIDKPTGSYSRMQSWCSACGKHSGIGGIESNRHKPYCPNCGARMKGGAE